MPFIQSVNRNQYIKNITGADYNRPSGVLKDSIHIVTAAEETSRIVTMPFRFIRGSHELEIYVNGEYKRKNELIGVTTYGDYEEYTNFSVQFNPGVVVASDVVRFRVTVSYYRTRDVAATVGSLEARVIVLEGQTVTLSGQISGITDNLLQLSRDAFGSSYVLAGNTGGSTRTIGTFVDGDTTPNVSTYRTWQTANTNPTSITTFDGCKKEDYRIILVRDDLTTFQHTATIHMKKDIDYLAVTGDVLFFVYNGTVWYQVGTFRDTNVVRSQILVWTLDGSSYRADIDVSAINNASSMAVKCWNNATGYQIVPSAIQLTSATNLRIWMSTNALTLNVVATG